MRKTVPRRVAIKPQADDPSGGQKKGAVAVLMAYGLRADNCTASRLP